MATFNGSSHFCGLIGTHSTWIITHDYCASITRIFWFLDIVLYKQRFFKGLIQKHVIAHSITPPFTCFATRASGKVRGGVGPIFFEANCPPSSATGCRRRYFWMKFRFRPRWLEMVNRRGWKGYLAELWIMESGNIRGNRHKGFFKRVDDNIFGGY
jgi:hypothetical protein